MALFHTPFEPAALRLQLNCDLQEERRAAQALREFLAAQHCSESERLDCELALVEACNNAIEHASPQARQMPLLVQILCSAHWIEVQVTDHTAGFDWASQPTLPPPEKESGRGLYLIRTLMDEASYLRSPGQNVLVLRKKRS